MLRLSHPTSCPRRLRPALELLEDRCLLSTNVGAFVTGAYQDLLGRTPEPGGLAYWSGRLDGGATPAQVALAMEEGQEYRTGLVRERFHMVLGRDVDPGGLTAGLQLLAAVGGEVAALDGALLGSTEFYRVKGGGTDGGFLAALYARGLGRPIDDGAFVAFTRALLGGASPSQLAAGVAASPEAQARRVRENYARHLGRDADALGLQSWLNGLEAGAISYAQFVAGLVGSPEFVARLQPLPPALPPTITDRAVTTDAGVQQMPSVAVDPTDANHVVIAYLDYSLIKTGYAGIGVAVSHDAGTTWQHTSVPLPAGFDQGAATPIAHFDAQGHVFVSFAAATFLGPKPTLTDPDGGNLRALGFQANNGIFVARSEDGGLTWQQPVSVAANLYDGQHPVPFEIKPDLAIDTFPTLPNGRVNPNYGDFYEVWSRYYPAGQFPGQPNSTGGSQIMLAISRDGGQTWQLQLQQVPGTSLPETVLLDPLNTGVPPPGLGAVNYPHLAVGPEGNVYVSLYYLGNFSVYRSTDGGKSFVAPDFAGTRGLPFGPSENLGPESVSGLPNDRFRTFVVRAVAADPSRSGSVYTADEIAPVDASGNYLDPGDVAFARSSDSGQSWQTTTQLGGRTASVLNDDNNGQITQGLEDDVSTGQALPRMAVDAQGDIAVIWYDTRRDPAKHLLDVFATVSSDGGRTFSPNFRLTDLSFDPNAGQFTDASGQPDYYLGDSLGLALANNTGYAAWTDTRNGNQDIEFTRFSLQPPPAPLNDRFSPNDTPTTATDLGRVVKTHQPKLTIPAGEEEWFRVQTASTGNLAMSATQEVAGVSPRLELRDARGATVLATGTDVTDASGQVIGQQLVFASVAGQTYDIRVLPGAEASRGGPSSYALDVQSLTADLGSQVYGELTNTLAAGDDAYYRLAVGAAGSLEAQLTPGAAFAGQVKLEVLDPDSLAVLASGTGNAIQTASLAVKQGQVVLLHVASEAGGHGDFTLKFTNLDQFATPQNTTLLFPAGQGPSQVAVADLNGDGKPDLVVSDAQANTVSVLLNNGDGTFQAPRQYAVGAFSTPVASATHFPNLGRAVAVADLTGNGIPDILVTNYASGDVSVLLGRGDGTFGPQRRFDATAGPFAMAVGDLTGNGILDLVVVGSTGGPGKVAVLLGRGDGTFLPPLLFDSPLTDANPVAAVQIATLTRGRPADLLLTDNLDPSTHVLFGNGDGTFRVGPNLPMLGPGLAVADLNGDGIPDVVNASAANNVISYALGNGDGTFQAVQQLKTEGDPFAMTVADFGSAVTNADGSISVGPPDGHPDLLVAASGETGVIFEGPPAVLFYPGQVDAQGKFAGFGDPIVLASPHSPIDIKTADFNGDGFPDAVVVEQDGVRVVYGKPPTIPANDTPQTARNLGTVAHVVEPTLTIVPGHTDAYYRLTVPSEDVSGAGDEVVDFSALFQAQEGAGLGMEVRDASGNLLGSGPRFRVEAKQGEVLTVHVFGVADALGVRGSGAYTLDIDVLPQVVSVQAQALLPGQGSAPGGPTASLVLSFQGDRLDPATAENPANYTVTWFGPDGLPGTPDDQVIPVRSTNGGPPVVYDPSTNVDVGSGNVQPTAVRQTVTLLFDQPLPAGSYRIDVAAAVQTAAFNTSETGLLAAAPGFTGHPVVSLNAGVVVEGSRFTAPDLVQAAGALGDFGGFRAGTPFLSQLHDDLGAVLDAGLKQLGDDPAVRQAIFQQILARFDPALGTPGQRPTGALVLWLDPVPLAASNSGGTQISYDPATDDLVNLLHQAFVSVVGNIEVIVIPTGLGGFTLRLGDGTPASARGGFAVFGQGGDRVQDLTDQIRQGIRQFDLGP